MFTWEMQHAFSSLQGPYGQPSNFGSLRFESGSAIYILMLVHVTWEVEYSFTTFASSCTPVLCDIEKLAVTTSSHYHKASLVK